MFKRKEKEIPEKEDLLGRIKEIEDRIGFLEKRNIILEEKQKRNLQRISLIRFNPFSEIGGDQSFSVAFLDDEKSGVVITSFYSKEGNRVYGKKIKRGECLHPLSNEEKEAISNAYEEN